MLELIETNEYKEHIYYIAGKLVVCKYYDAWSKDTNFGQYGSCSVFDYIDKAKKLITERYGNNFQVVLSIPDLVVRLD